MTNEEMIERAASVVRPRRVGEFSMGDVGCALVTDRGSLFLGVCIDTSSSLGFCAEHAAVAAMVTAGEYRIRRVVAVSRDGRHTYVLSPCGRCREFMRQVDESNLEAEVILGAGRVVRLAELLPFHDWHERQAD